MGINAEYMGVLVNSKPIVIPVGKVVVVKDIVDHTVIAEVLMTPDHVVVVKAPRFLLEEVKTNGQIIEVVPSVQLKNKLCGVCGNFQKPIMTETVTGRCVYSKPELEIASWMIPAGSSSVMSPSILAELKKETEICPKMTVEPTKVAKAYKVATGKCTILRHLIQKRPGQVCLSKVPVTQCGPSCKPQKSQLTVKAVPFTCLPEVPWLISSSLARNCLSLPPRSPPSLPRCACHLPASTPWSPRESNSTTRGINHPNTEPTLASRT